MRQVLALGITEGRQAARTLGRRSIAAAFSVSEAVSVATRFADASRAYEVARAHVIHVQLAEAKAELEGLTGARRAALDATAFRVETIAATETFTAASEERLAAAREAQQATGILLEKVWNAEGDACPVCRGMHGTAVLVDEDFPGGADPGAAHPRCRCWVEIHSRTTGRKVA